MTNEQLAIFLEHLKSNIEFALSETEDNFVRSGAKKPTTRAHIVAFPECNKLFGICSDETHYGDIPDEHFYETSPLLDIIYLLDQQVESLRDKQPTQWHTSKSG